MPMTPLGRCWTFSIHWAHRGAGFACAIQAVRLTGGPTVVPRACCVGIAAIAKLRGRSRTAVVEPSLACKVPHRVPVGRLLCNTPDVTVATTLGLQYSPSGRVHFPTSFRLNLNQFQ
jgi:hypothetical protein